MIKKTVVKIFIFCLPIFVFAFGGFRVNEMSSLTEFSKTHIGEYECVRATYGDRDLLSEYKSVILTLKKDGTFFVRATSQNGVQRSQDGKYAFDFERSLLTFWVDVLGKTHQKSAVLQNGEFVLEKRCNNVNLTLKFAARP